MAKKTVTKQQREMRKVQTKEEVIKLINKHAEFERVHMDNAIDILRQTLQSQIIANLALADVLIEKGIITQDEYEKQMENIAKAMDEMIQKGE